MKSPFLSGTFDVLTSVLPAVSLTAIASLAVAMPAPFHVRPGSALAVRAGSVANGGRAQDEFSLLSVGDAVSAKGERLVLNYGDRFGKVWKGEPGFFQIALDRGGTRIVIDLSQVNRTGVDPMQLKKALSRSRFVASTDMTMDPQDQTTNLTLTLKSPVTLHLATASGARSQVILDLKAR
jgi:hypothetical protein